MDTLPSLLAYSRENQRICPQPMRWNELYQLLPDKHQLPSGGWEPPLPLILAAWHDTPALLKQLRLQEHIEWTHTHGALDQVSDFLRALPERDWYHLGEK